MHRYAALRWAEAPGRSGFVPQPGHKEFLLTAYFVMPEIRNSVRFRYTQTALPERGGPALAPAARGECMGLGEIGP